MIGRFSEVNELKDLYYGNRAELVAIYGRRRVGKTFLVDETFKGCITFRHAGLSPIEMTEKKEKSDRSLKLQLQAFYYSLLYHGMKKSHCPKDWLEAFFMLETFLNDIDDGSRQLIFLDELPWMDTPHSGFLTAFEGFWNIWACHRNNLMVIVCGSANSWILDNLVNNHGGLYNRITHEIKLRPFTLRECESCLLSNNVKLSKYDIVQAYMILGGIPYYLNYFQRGKSLSQNIDNLFFGEKAKLRNEYNRLFSSIFSNPDTMKAIVKVLSMKGIGFTRKEIAEKTGYSEGGTLTDALKALIASDFIEKYIPFGLSKRESYYRLTDPFCLFYLHFIEHSSHIEDSFWKENLNSPSVTSWRGLAFENVCFNHKKQIQNALGISGVYSEFSSWCQKDEISGGTQIDMLISRRDNIVDMCEIKFYSGEFSVTKSYHQHILHRQMLLSEKIPKKNAVHNVLITTYGLVYNAYSGIFDNILTLDDLFEKI